jgi:prolyl 4-hydroxylase
MSNLKEHLLNFESFIGGWYIPEDMCDEMIKTYDLNKNFHVEGTVGTESNVDHSRKKSRELIFAPDIFFNTFPIYATLLQECLMSYLKKYEYAEKVQKFSINTNVKIQYYDKNEGFKNFHFENEGMSSSLKRHLVFMTYLNNVEDGGTEFKYQNLITPAKKGLTLIWPAQWTHTHRGQISNTKEKYIVTGWFNFYE